MTRVFDIDGTEKDLAWLAKNYDGCTVLPARVQPGETEAWRLEAIFVQGNQPTKAPAVLKVETRGPDNRPVANQPVVMTFPSLESPNPDLQDLTAFANRWADRGVVHRTDGDGMFGFGLGSAYGPLYHAWVLSSAASDCLTNTGMKGGTDHYGPLHGVWMLQPVVNNPPVPIEPGGDDDLLAAVKAMHADLKALGVHLGAW